MTTCPACNNNTIVLRAMAAVEFTVYPTDTPDAWLIHGGSVALAHPRMTSLANPYYKCVKCGCAVKIVDTVLWYDTKQPVEVVDRYPAHLRRLSPPVPAQHEEPKPAPYRAGIEHYMGCEIEILDFKTTHTPFAFTVRRPDGTVPLYGGRFESYVKARVVAMWMIENIS